MQEIEFYDREKEIHEILSILKSPPNLITFVYGPINSGKSSLMLKITDKLPMDYVVFYIDLRERFITGYEDFVKVLFKTHKTKVKDYKRFLIKALESLSFDGIPIPKNLLVEFLKEKEVEDVFEYIVTVFEILREKEKIPVLVLDELQVIGDLKIDDFLIYRLFNLFVSIAKKRHLAHIFAVTSDSLFIEKVYSEAMLHGRCRYLLVDDFNYDVTKGFLKKHGFSNEDVKLTWNYFGGKPVYLVEAVRNKHRLREFCEEMLRIRVGQVEEIVFKLKKENETMFKGVVELLKVVGNEENIRYKFITDVIRFLVRNNVLFADPTVKILKPQSKLDLLAIREIVNSR